jgi:hypothetical protein
MDVVAARTSELHQVTPTPDQVNSIAVAPFIFRAFPARDVRL